MIDTTEMCVQVVLDKDAIGVMMSSDGARQIDAILHFSGFDLGKPYGRVDHGSCVEYYQGWVN